MTDILMTDSTDRTIDNRNTYFNTYKVNKSASSSTVNPTTKPTQSTRSSSSLISHRFSYLSSTVMHTRSISCGIYRVYKRGK